MTSIKLGGPAARLEAQCRVRISDLLAGDVDWRVLVATRLDRLRGGFCVSGPTILNLPTSGAHMSPHIYRVVQEKRELDQKRDRLRAFMESDEYCALPEIERSLLAHQSNHMRDYSDVLERRIAAS